jgi:microcystin-dependent protein
MNARQSIILLGCATLLAAASFLLVRECMPQATEPSRPNDGILQRLDALPPVGACIPYFGNDSTVPPGWAIVKGQILDERSGYRQSDVHPSLWKKKLPDLRGRFPRGLQTGETLGKEGGRDAIPEHATANDGAHVHTLKDPERVIEGFTGPIALQDDKWKQHSEHYSVTDSFGSHKDNIILLTGGPADQVKAATGQHRHKFGEGDATAKSAGVVPTEPNEGAHSHRIPAQEFVPSYVALNYIIRIR